MLCVPLLSLLAVVKLSQESLSVRLVGLDNPFQFLHEQQFEQALVSVQVCQLEELPLQNMIIFDRSPGVDLQPVWDFCRVVGVGGHQLVALCLPWLVGDGWEEGWRLIVPGDTGSTWMPVLGPFVDMIHIVNTKLW